MNRRDEAVNELTEKDKIAEAWCDGFNTRELEIQAERATLTAERDRLRDALRELCEASRAMQPHLIAMDADLPNEIGWRMTAALMDGEAVRVSTNATRLFTDAQEVTWLEQWQGGTAISTIASDHNLAYYTVYNGIIRQQKRLEHSDSEEIPTNPLSPLRTKDLYS